jgi:hypothetical protein
LKEIYESNVELNGRVNFWIWWAIKIYQLTD